ncbi:histidine kinase [Brevundimonas sp. MYb46]|nr:MULTISPECIES: ATP-binding protein [unclassified Brevundimonas]PRA27645.1 histidine kinase [Brevundimonas sp. MYb27]PRB18079.1 histidine kinase [Brevundimonas sp. MYb52]PRB38008.1 histidine kinase [Brevundimonas sp. MYb46]
MIDQISFQTAARTVDHLGREQIADAPTAVSELWKNAFDAYATDVELNVYDGSDPVAALLDNGHGMNREDFVSRWLVVGTQSKITADTTSADDRNGLRPRPRQGQKGIGRLSCANLGPLLLFVSKRRNQKIVAALVDWRLFENPFLTLGDIRLPVTELDSLHELLPQLPELARQLLRNVDGDGDENYSKRVIAAWSSFDALHTAEVRDGSAVRETAPAEAIRRDLARLPFNERHLAQWQVWTGEAEHGTALIVGGLTHDLAVHVQHQILSPIGQDAKDRLIQTLSSFVDPFYDPSSHELNAVDPHFHYAVRTWRGDRSELLLGTDKQFSLRDIEPLEHRIEGRLGPDGVFRGRVKAFGEWQEARCEIRPPADLRIGGRADAYVGPIDIVIASMEFSSANTTHTQQEFTRFTDLAKRFAGLMMFRDGLRVMPFGRPDNDFFEIESRRTKSAGREFWNHRQMFGRLAISRYQNPNLKDKAGREGLLDNTAAKTLRRLIENILMKSAREYFGSASRLRADLLPEIRNTNAREKAAAAREKLRTKHRKQFRERLMANLKDVPSLAGEVHRFCRELRLDREQSVINAQVALESFNDRFLELHLGVAPQPLGSLEEAYGEYRREMGGIQSDLRSIAERVYTHVASALLAEPDEILRQQIRRNGIQVNARIQSWEKEIQTLQRLEYARIDKVIDDRRAAFTSYAEGLQQRFADGELQLSEASKLVEELRARIDRENMEILVPYIGALESLRDSIDLQNLATAGMEELSELRVELDRLNALAQLGIAVEIVGHELQDYDDIIGAGLRSLPQSVQGTTAVRDITFGYEGITDQLRFLSPLRLAGQRVERLVTGEEIVDYVAKFFDLTLTRNRVSLQATDAFLRFRVFDQPSRLLPVFVNLINNSIYWVGTSPSDAERTIRLDVRDQVVVVSDSGPGVAAEDVPDLFNLFFTRRPRGGRGVGLYLSRANLSAGGHRINYVTEGDLRLLDGANFAIEFRGGEFE